MMISLQGLQEKGKEYSDIAEDMEQRFQYWLQFSCMTEDEFLKRINQNNFEIQYNYCEEYFEVVQINFWDSEKIGESIVEVIGSNLEIEESLMEFILLLNLIKVKVQENKGNPRTIAKLCECSLRLKDRINNMEDRLLGFSTGVDGSVK